MKPAFLLSLCLLVTFVSSQEIFEDEKIAFVFETVRHGARTNFQTHMLEHFKVGRGMLTAEGMRERHMLGRFNRERYVDQYKLLSPEYNPSEIFIQSTNVNRTMQSEYSELLGLYPPNEQVDYVTPKAIQNSKLPFNVRDAHILNDILEEVPLPFGF